MEEKKTKLYQKWWFWLCMVLIALIISFTIIMMVGFSLATNGINEVARTIQDIDNEATLYSSAGGHTVVVEVPNYTDSTKKDKIEKIENAIKKYSKKDNILSNYSKFILITKMNSDNKSDYFYITHIYSLPSMAQLSEDGKTYIDFVEFTKESLGSSTSSNSNSTLSTSSTKGEDITLKQGNYVVGEDVKAGKYDVIAINGTSGNISIEGGSWHGILSDKNNDYGWEKTYSNLTLKNGQTVKITNGLQVKLQAK